MTSAIPGRAASARAAATTSAPAVRISRAALQLNLRAVLSTVSDAVIDVRADAWGHGASEVARAALEAGAGALLVDEHARRVLADEVDSEALTVDRAAVNPDAVFGLSEGFAPVMSLQGWVLSLKPLRAGEGVSYGYTYRAPHDTVIALVTGGYAQGVVRALGNSAHVAIGGRQHRVVGRVAMDVCVVDVGSTGVARGDEVVFFGDPSRGEPSLSDWTAATGMTAAELATAVGLRSPREYAA